MNTGPSRSSTRNGRGPVDARAIAHLKVARGWLGGLVVASTVAGVAAIAQAFALGTFVVRLLTAPDSTTWHSPAIWLLVVALGRAGAGWISDLCAAKAAGQVTVHLRHRVLQAALDQGYAASSRQRAGELGLLATRGVSAVEPYVTRYLPALVVATVLPVATVVAIATQDWLSALVVVLTIPLIPVFAVLIGLATQERSDRQWRTLSVLSGHFLDVVRGLPTLVAFRRAKAQSSRIRAVTDAYRKTTNETLKVAFMSSAALELIATISVAVVAVTVGLRLAGGTVDFRTALVVLLMAPEAYWPLRRVGAEFHAAAEGTTTFAKIAELLDQSPAPAQSRVALPTDADLEISHLTVGYDDTAVLSDLNAVIASRGLTALTGPSGCGKSTLLAALLGELPISGGEIRIGAVTVHDALPRWQEMVAHVGQRPWIITGSIADNVRIGAPAATDAEIESALRRVDLDLPLAAPVGEDGRLLSAGQRARLALARVVAAGRAWIFLDEPTAHLDSATEAVLLETITELARHSAVVVVAHRPALVAAADHVIALPARAVPARSVPALAVGELARPRVSTAAVVAPPAEPAPLAGPGRRFLGVVLAALASGFGVALTATAGWLIARAAEQPPVLYLMVAIVSVRLFGLGRPALRYLERLVTHDSALRLLAERRARVYDVLVPLAPARLGRRRGDLLTSIVDDVDALVDDQLRVRLPRATWVSLTVAAALVGLVNDTGAALVIALASLVGGGGAWLLARSWALRHEPLVISTRSDISAAVVDLLTHARSLVLWQRDQSAIGAVDELGQESARATSGSAFGLGLGRAVAMLCGAAGVVGVGLVVAPLLSQGSLTAPAAALLLLLPIAMIDVAAPLADAGSLSVRTAAAAARVESLRQVCPAVREPAHPQTVAAAEPDLSLHEVSAGWDDQPVLVGLCVDLPARRHLGVVGPSGCGKSTLAALLLKFLMPLDGSQRLGGVDVVEVSGDEVRRLTGLVDDDPYIFSSTLAENIRLASPAASDEDIETALRAAHLGPWLDGLPQGLATHLGEGNVGVSGGERARLGLARAVLADTPVLVLDEPTAHLDTETAQAVTNDLLDASRDRSLVWITHTEVGLDRMDAVLDLS